MICFFKFPLEDSLGGAEFHMLKLAKYFVTQGQKIKLFTSDRYLFRLFEKNRLPRRRMFLGWEPTSKWALLLWPPTFLIARRKLKNLLKELPAGGVLFMQSLIEKLVLTPLTLTLSHEGRGNRKEFPSLDGRGKGRVLWLEHKVPGRWLKLNPLKFRYLALAKKVQLVTVSNFAKTEFVKLGVPEKNIQVIYPGIDTKTPSPPPPHEGEKKVGVVVGILSRLDPEKGVYDFLKIIAPQLAKHPDWQILIAGEGPNIERIINIIDQYNLPKQVKLLGFVNDLDKFFSQVSVLVYPSKVPESFGLSVLEALARGIPVIASKIGALSEIIEHEKNGFLVEFTHSPSPPPEGKGENKEGVRWIKYLERLQDPNVYQALSQNALASVQKFTQTKMLEAFDNSILQT